MNKMCNSAYARSRTGRVLQPAPEQGAPSCRPYSGSMAVCGVAHGPCPCGLAPSTPGLAVQMRLSARGTGWVFPQEPKGDTGLSEAPVRAPEPRHAPPCPSSVYPCWCTRAPWTHRPGHTAAPRPHTFALAFLCVCSSPGSSWAAAHAQIWAYADRLPAPVSSMELSVTHDKSWT